MVTIDLFSGAGGLTEGFWQEKYDIMAHVEKEKWACETLKTRICYHYLKKENDLELYFNYIKESNCYLNIEEKREIIYKKYPELREKLQVEVLNKTFGNPANDSKTTSTSEVVRLIEEALKFNNKQTVDLIIGGPPCQAYSLIGRARMKDNAKRDKRNYLFYYYKTIVEYFKPKLFIFENVPGILNAQKGQMFDTIKEEFSNIGYKLMTGRDKNDKKNILNASDYGVYQNRKRVILIGIRDGLDIKYPDFSQYSIKFDEPKTTMNAIGDLPILQCGEGEDFSIMNYRCDSQTSFSEFQKLMRKDSEGVLNHRARVINQERDQVIYRLAIKKAQNSEQLHYYDIPDKYKTHKNQVSFTDRFKVHWWDDMPHTVVAHISKDGHYNIHPDLLQSRSLTVREAARIQSFPDNFKFEGPRTHQFMQVGNAVPPLMAQAVARAIKDIN